MSYLICTQYTDTYGCISPASKNLLGLGYTGLRQVLNKLIKFSWPILKKIEIFFFHFFDLIDRFSIINFFQVSFEKFLAAIVQQRRTPIFFCICPFLTVSRFVSPGEKNYGKVFFSCLWFFRGRLWCNTCSNWCLGSVRLFVAWSESL